MTETGFGRYMATLLRVLSLAFIDCHCIAQRHRQLSSFELRWHIRIDQRHYYSWNEPFGAYSIFTYYFPLPSIAHVASCVTTTNRCSDLQFCFMVWYIGKPQSVQIFSRIDQSLLFVARRRRAYTIGAFINPRCLGVSFYK